MKDSLRRNECIYRAKVEELRDPDSHRKAYERLTQKERVNSAKVEELRDPDSHRKAYKRISQMG